MSAQALLLWAAIVSADAYSIDRALEAALEFDSQAYVQICKSRARQRQFHSLLRRASGLNDKFISRFRPGDIVLRNVDRRPAGACQNPKRFSQTVALWSQALDDIELALDKDS